MGSNASRTMVASIAAMKAPIEVTENAFHLYSIRIALPYAPATRCNGRTILLARAPDAGSTMGSRIYPRGAQRPLLTPTSVPHARPRRAGERPN